MTQRIRYRRGYKYQLAESWRYATPIIGNAARIDSAESCAPWVSLDADGALTLREGYAWDGPSGPTIDSPSGMRASLAHDALYQLLRAGKLPPGCREAADRLFYDLLRHDGMWPGRAWLWYNAVRQFAGPAAARRSDELLTAP